VSRAVLAAHDRGCSPIVEESGNPCYHRAGHVEDGVTLNDFYSYMPMHKYIFAPTGDLWPAASVNAQISSAPVGREHGRSKATSWLDVHRHVEQITWIPGFPQLIRDRLVVGGGWIERTGCVCFNLYRSPQVKDGIAALADRWLEHLYRIYPEDAQHILAWLAHRVQKPGEKINHALILGGAQGIGKDSILEPVKIAIGPWNLAEVSPRTLLGRFNGFAKSVILRVSEARDLGEVDRYSFYEHIKTYTAAPPDVLRVDEKNLREYEIWNVCGVVITTNHKVSGLYLPADDRRHYVAWSNATKEDFATSYWNDLYAWYAREGNWHVAAFLGEFDLTDFDSKAPPPHTPAFFDIVDANRSPEDAELADVLDGLGHPDAITLLMIAPSAEEFRRMVTRPEE
jgi:hypothetical protein